MREKVSCPLPAVLSVDLGLYTHRVPRHNDFKKAAAIPFQKIAGPVDSRDSAVTILHTTPPCPRTRRTPAPDSGLPSFERIQQLLAGSKIEKKGRMLAGDPGELAEGIMDYLREHGFVES